MDSNKQSQLDKAMMRRAQRQMVISGVLFLIMAVAVAVAVFAFLERDDANQEAQQANTQAAAAEQRFATSEAAQQETARDADQANTLVAAAALAELDARATADAAATLAAELENEVATRVALAEGNAATAVAGEAQAIAAADDAATRVALAEGDAAAAAAAHEEAQATANAAATQAQMVENAQATTIAFAENNEATAVFAQEQAQAVVQISSTQAAMFTEETPDSTDSLVAQVGSNSGDLAPGGVNLWTFEGQGGQVVSIETLAEWDTVLALYDPRGIEIAYSDDRSYPADTTSLLPEIRLESSGTFEIEVYGFEVEDAGPYTLVISEAGSEAAAGDTPSAALDDFYANSAVIYPAQSGEIRSGDVLPSTLFTRVFEPDFLLDIDILNRDSDWDMVVSFRNAYSLLVASDGLWALVQHVGDEAEVLDGGFLSDMVEDELGTNSIQLGAWGETAIVAVNGLHVSSVDVSAYTGFGEIWITSSLLDEDTALTYDNLTIRHVSEQERLVTEDLLQQGAAAYDGQEYEEAIALYTQVIARNPDYIEAYMLRGISSYFEDDYDAARVDFSHALSLEESGWAYNWRGWVSFLQGDAQAGLDDLNSAVALDEGDVFFYMDRAVIHAALGDNEAALADYERAIDINGGYVFDYDSFESGTLPPEEYVYLAEIYTQAADVAPDNFMAHMLLGNSVANLTDFGSAVETFQRVIELMPDFAPAYKALGDLYYLQEDSAAARPMYEAYMNLVGEGSAVLDAISERLAELAAGEG